MVNGAHVLLYSKDPDADRAFFRDVLQFRAVDAGHGWLIFALPPAELAVHPGDGDFVQSHAEHAMLGAVVYLGSKGITCTEVSQAPWGMKTTVRLPSGGEIGLYQPSHPTAIG